MRLRHLVAPLLLLVATVACDGSTEPQPRVPPARLTIVDGDGQEGEVGTELPTLLAVLVEDARGRPLAAQRVDFRVLEGGGTTGVGYAVTGSDGIARERWTLGIVAADSQRLEARAVDARTGAPVVSAVFRARAHPGAPVSMERGAGNGQRGIVGQLLPSSVEARVRDRFGNPVPGVMVDWAPTTAHGQADPGRSATDASGVARTYWTLSTVAGELSLTARVEVLGELAFTATAFPAGPARLARLATAAGLTGSAGGALPAMVGVRVTDAFGNAVPDALVRFHVGSAGASVSPPTVTTDADGVARTQWTLGTAAGTHELFAETRGVPDTARWMAAATTTASDAPARSAARRRSSGTPR